MQCWPELLPGEPLNHNELTLLTSQRNQTVQRIKKLEQADVLAMPEAEEDVDECKPPVMNRSIKVGNDRYRLIRNRGGGSCC